MKGSLPPFPSPFPIFTGPRAYAHLETLVQFAENILVFQDVEDVLSERNEEWLDMDKEMWEKATTATEALKGFLNDAPAENFGKQGKLSVVYR